MGLSLFTSSMCDPDPEDPKLEVSTHEITLDAEGETQSFTIDSNVSWTITGNKSWLSVSPTMGKKDATVVLTAQQNTNVGNRDCLLTIMSADGGVSQTVKVVQDSAEGELRVNGSTSASLSFGADGGEKQQINITANSDWTITSIPDWIRVSPVNGSKNSTITVTIDNHIGRPLPTISLNIKSSSSLPSLRWSRFLASSRRTRYSSSSFFFKNVIP